MSALVEALAKARDEIKADFSTKAVDGWTREEVFSFMLVSTGKCVAVAQGIGGTGAEKKAAVVEAVNYIYTEIVAPMDLPGVPNYLEPAVDWAGGIMVSHGAPALVEGALAFLKSMRVPGFAT